MAGTTAAICQCGGGNSNSNGLLTGGAEADIARAPIAAANVEERLSINRTRGVRFRKRELQRVPRGRVEATAGSCTAAARLRLRSELSTFRHVSKAAHLQMQTRSLFHSLSSVNFTAVPSVQKNRRSVSAPVRLV
jgi:hypothetical protein